MLALIAFSLFEIVSRILLKLSDTFSKLYLAAGRIFLMLSEKDLVYSIWDLHSFASLLVVIVSLAATFSHSRIQSL